jgi:hypothetical protein
VAEGELGDGRVFIVEEVSFGKKHEVGRDLGVLERFRAWWPGRFWDAISPRIPKTKIEEEEPALVVWLRAEDSISRTNRDCQGVRLELIDSEGAVYGEHQPHWFGYEKGFSRVGHVFQVFPRHEKKLKLRVVAWRGTNEMEVTLENPGVTEARDWEGAKVPVGRQVGIYEVVLREIVRATNRAQPWRGAGAHWKPEFELRKRGESLDGWDLEWIAEDEWGNRGHSLGLKPQVLKVEAMFYPRGTNLVDAIPVRQMPVEVLGSNAWWNATAVVDGGGERNEVKILGLFEAGVHTFSDGEYLTNPPAKFAPVQGGSPSGWVGSSRRTPLKVERYDGHYTDVPVIYVKVGNPNSRQRIAMRVRDVESGAYYLAESEGQGARSGIVPFLVREPNVGKKVEAELVFLLPVRAEFLVETAAGAGGK